MVAPKSPADVADIVRLALAEDVGPGDVTADLIPASTVAQAEVICREQAVLCGQPWFDEVFSQLSKDVDVRWKYKDSDSIAPDAVVCHIGGPARAVLSGERTALNFLQNLSATATATRQYVEAVEDTDCEVLDTRKTIPGFRSAQKYAVACGGATNHRMGLYDAILIKENHIAAAGSVTAAIEAARKQHEGLAVEIEVESGDELLEALTAGADRLLLDNFPLNDLRRAVTLTRETAPRTLLEASGGIELATVGQVAETGVDFVSVGAITKSVEAIDFSMQFLS